MRNIKTTLRNTRNSGMLFAAASGLLYLTACTSDVLYDAPNENITESNVIIGNDPAAQAHRIHFFGNQGTRAGELDAIFPEIESEPTSIPELETVCSFSEWCSTASSPESYIIPSCSWGSNQITVGGNVYITGNVSGVNTLCGSGTVYLLSSGNLDLTDQFLQIESGVTLKSYKDINVSKDLKNYGCLLTDKKYNSWW